MIFFIFMGAAINTVILTIAMRLDWLFCTAILNSKQRNLRKSGKNVET